MMRLREDAPWLTTPVDWEATPVGPIARWPQALLSALDVISASRIPMLITWGAERTMFYNAAYAPILVGKPEALGRSVDQVFPEAWSVIGEAFLRAESGESVYYEDLRIPITRHGATSDSWWSFSYSPVVSKSGTTEGVLCVVFETTRANLAEARERAGQEELRRITDLVPSLLWRADSFGRTIWQSGRFMELSAANDASPSNVWRKLIHPDDLDAVMTELAAAKTGRRVFAKSLRLKVSASEHRWHQVRSEPTFGETGVLTGWCGVATDIHDSRTAVEALGEREALFGQFAANSASMLWTVDLETLQIERLSRNFASVWPNLPASWTWPEFMASIHPADRAVVQQGFDRVRQGEVAHGRFRVNAGPGDIRILEGTTFPIRSPNGRVNCLGGIITDTTPDVRRDIHLIEADEASQNKLSHQLRNAGFNVKAFRTVVEFANVASALAAAPILYRHRGDGEELARLSGLVRSTLRRTPWLVLHDEGQTSRDAIQIMKMGACDIVESNASIGELEVALSTALSSLKPAAPAAAGRGRPTTYRLTVREKEILDGIVAGGTNKTIAQHLNLSPRTVESHRGRLMERLAVGSLAELVALASHPSFRCMII